MIPRAPRLSCRAAASARAAPIVARQRAEVATQGPAAVLDARPSVDWGCLSSRGSENYERRGPRSTTSERGPRSLESESTVTEQNKDIARRFFALLTDGDIEAAASLLRRRGRFLAGRLDGPAAHHFVGRSTRDVPIGHRDDTTGIVFTVGGMLAKGNWVVAQVSARGVGKRQRVPQPLLLLLRDRR